MLFVWIWHMLNNMVQIDMIAKSLAYNQEVMNYRTATEGMVGIFGQYLGQFRRWFELCRSVKFRYSENTQKFALSSTNNLMTLSNVKWKVEDGSIFWWLSRNILTLLAYDCLHAGQYQCQLYCKHTHWKMSTCFLYIINQFALHDTIMSKK